MNNQDIEKLKKILKQKTKKSKYKKIKLVILGDKKTKNDKIIIQQ